MAVDAASIDLPASPGVYLFKTAEGRVLYVGKQLDLTNAFARTSQQIQTAI